MKTKTATVNGQSKQDVKNQALFDGFLRRMRELRVEMKRSKAEIDRLKAASRRKLAEIDALLKAC